MKEVRLIMGMPVTVEIVDAAATEKDLTAVFDYFTYIDEKFSTYKPESEIMKINRGEIAENEWSDDMRLIFALAEDTKLRSDGFFDLQQPASTNSSQDANSKSKAARPFYDPSGIVKGWAIFQAAKLLEQRELKNFYVDAGGDIQTHGQNAKGEKWSVGIKNPLKGREQPEEIVKTVYVSGEGVATSGNYIRGEHIYNPKTGTKPPSEIVSLTVIGPNIYEADRFATAAFAMGTNGIHFIEKLDGFEGYMIDKNGMATMTNGFARYTKLAD